MDPRPYKNINLTTFGYIFIKFILIKSLKKCHYSAMLRAKAIKFKLKDWELLSTSRKTNEKCYVLVLLLHLRRLIGSWGLCIPIHKCVIIRPFKLIGRC